jgi:hypothetical protein
MDRKIEPKTEARRLEGIFIMQAMSSRQGFAATRKLVLLPEIETKSSNFAEMRNYELILRVFAYCSRCIK